MCHYYRGKKFHYSLHDALAQGQGHESIVHLTHPSRSYATFATWGLFEIWYNTLGSKHVDEVIASVPQKFRVDIDIPSKHSKSREFYESCVEDAYTTISSIMTCYGLSPEIVRYDSNVLGSCKYSTHMIVSNLVMPSWEVCRSLARILHHSMDPDHRQYIDMCVYKRVQNFRIEGSSKPGEHRPKTRVPMLPALSPVSACGEHLGPLHEGLITCCYGAMTVSSSIGVHIRDTSDPSPRYCLSNPNYLWEDDDDGQELRE